MASYALTSAIIGASGLTLQLSWGSGWEDPYETDTAEINRGAESIAWETAEMNPEGGNLVVTLAFIGITVYVGDVITISAPALWYFDAAISEGTAVLSNYVVTNNSTVPAPGSALPHIMENGLVVGDHM